MLIKIIPMFRISWDARIKTEILIGMSVVYEFCVSVSEGVEPELLIRCCEIVFLVSLIFSIEGPETYKGVESM